MTDTRTKMTDEETAYRKGKYDGYYGNSNLYRPDDEAYSEYMRGRADGKAAQNERYAKKPPPSPSGTPVSEDCKEAGCSSPLPSVSDGAMTAALAFVIEYAERAPANSGLRECVPHLLAFETENRRLRAQLEEARSTRNSLIKRLGEKAYPAAASTGAQ